MHRPHLEYALALHDQLAADGDRCWSPYSAAAALGLAAAGARGTTRDELAAVLAPGGSLPDVTGLLERSAEPVGAEAAVANSLWLDQRLHCTDDYQRRVRALPGGAVHRVDFRHRPEAARQRVNEDVAQTTRGLIQELIGPGMLGTDTAVVLVNALYLKVAWLHAFRAELTAPAPFRARSGTREVPMMRQQETVPYATSGGWALATLPTAGQVAVDVLLPPEAGAAPGTPPADLVAGLQRAARPTMLDLRLPRFTVEWSVLLNPALRRLGVAAAFTPGGADFSGVTPDEQIFIDLVLHKTRLRVDEQGFEGAAATAVVMRTVSMQIGTPVPFHADRPFLLLVRHRRTGAVYFLAWVEEAAAPPPDRSP